MGVMGQGGVSIWGGSTCFHGKEDGVQEELSRGAASSPGPEPWPGAQGRLEEQTGRVHVHNQEDTP